MKKTIMYGLLLSQAIFFILLPLWMQLTNYLHPLVIGVVWFGFSFIALFIVCWVTKEEIRISAWVFHFTTLFYSMALLILLFFRPNTQKYDTFNLIPFDTIIFYLSGEVQLLISFYNLGANIGLFIPFGLYYRYISQKPSFIRMLLITIVLICMIEGFQFITRRGSLDVDDLLLNVLGVSIGYVIYPVFQKVFVMKD
ncbi:VanZ family protein [Virgibacillus necropolis]|uniref:VanZ family protein n=1 Tax=Virgibacillus necropolis TaxID=163877 RepID=UPI0038506F13